MISAGSLTIVSLLSFVFCLLFSVCQAHVEFSVNTDTANDDGFLTYLKVPHGCILAGSDGGDAPESDIEAATNMLQITIPAEIPIVVPGVVNNWSLSRVLIPSISLPQQNISIFTYRAQTGYELLPWQAMIIPFVFSTPSPLIDTTYFMPVIQSCVGGYIVNWTTDYTGPDGGPDQPVHPTPSITILGTSDATPIVGGGTITEASSSDTAMSICAIILAGLLTIGACIAIGVYSAKLHYHEYGSHKRDIIDKDTQIQLTDGHHQTKNPYRETPSRSEVAV